MDMTHPNDRRYAKSHEWFMVSGNQVMVGITPFAAHELTDITFVEPPKVGREVKAGQSCGEIESVKATAEIFSALSGKVVEVNSRLKDHPELLNSDPLKEGWIFKMEVAELAPLQSLMDGPAYNKFISG